MPFLRFLGSFLILIPTLSSFQASADFGNWFTANKRVPTVLNGSGQKLSYRFTCQQDMELSAAAIYCVEAVDPPAYLVSLQEDIQGRPSGTALAVSSYVPRAQSWSTLPMQPIPLVKGKVYHLVVEQDVKRGGDHSVGVIGENNYASFLSTDVLNHLHPNDGSPDPATNTLWFNGNQWKDQDTEPVYVIYGAQERCQGNPYDEPGTRPIYGSGDPSDKSTEVWRGEALHFHCGFQATHFSIRVKKVGHPTSPLNYYILKNDFLAHKTIPVHSAVALTPDQAPSQFKWVTIGFDDKNASNFSPECWFLVFQTDSGKIAQTPEGCNDCYLLADVGNSGGLAQAADLTFDGGPHLTRSVYSLDDGDATHWLDEFERDANIGAIGPSCPPSAVNNEPLPIPTPEPLEDDGDFQP